jgi:hypothetical protein
MDYLKQLSALLGGKIRSQNLSNWNLNGTSLRELIVKDYRGYKINIDEYDGIFEIRIIQDNLESDFALSINLPNKLHGFTTPTNVNNSNYNIYLSPHNYPNLLENKDFVEFWNPFCGILNELTLSEIEGVFFLRGAIYLALNYQRDLISTLDRTIDLINTSPLIFYKIENEKIFKRNIPEDLRPLIPLLKKWCVADDSEREQLMEETSARQKANLINAVYPHMVSINKFLDSFGDEPLSHEAILLGNLAELTSELQITNS